MSDGQIEVAGQRVNSYARWPRWGVIRLFRRFLVRGILFPLVATGYKVEAVGRENFDRVDGACLIVANHNMKLDQSLLLRAMPPSFRHRVAIAAAASDIYGNPVRGFGASLFGNAFPFSTAGHGVRDSLDHVVEMLDEGWHVLMFPEGRLTRVGPMKPFKVGAGLISVEAGVPVLPMRLDVLKPGIFEGRRFWWPRGRVRVVIGAPVTVPPETQYAAAAALLEGAVRDA